MPQLQVINTGASPLNTALGNISAGFIEQFNQRQNQARNDEIFSRIKSKYGPNVDADTIYKDVLQSNGFDQSYKQNVLKMISDYAALQKDSSKTNYDQIRLQQYKEGLGISKQNAETSTLNAKNRAKQLEIAESRLTQSINNRPHKVADDFSKYVTSAYRLEGKNIPAHQKALIEKAGIQAIQNGATPQEAFLIGQQAWDQYDKTVKSIQAPINPERSTYSPGRLFEDTPKKVEESKQQLYETLFTAYMGGVKSPEDLRTIAKSGQWPESIYNPMIQKIIQNPNKAIPQEQVNAIFQ